MYDVAVLSVTLNIFAKQPVPISRIYSDRSIGALQHVSCSLSTMEAHRTFNDLPRAPPHNMCMEDERDQVAVEMGRRLCEDRKAAGWTQRDLAIKTGWTSDVDDGEQRNVLSPSQIGNYEQGTRRIRHEEAILLGNIFDRAPPYYLAVISDQESDVIVAMRRSAA